MTELYQVVPVTDETTSCLIIPSTDGCCEVPLVVELVKPCEHGNYSEHIIHGTAKLNERFGRWFVAAHSWCDGKKREVTDE